MIQKINGQSFYHINKKPFYSAFPIMQKGTTYNFSPHKFNPFFGYYENFPDLWAMSIPKRSPEDKISSIESLRLFSNFMGNPVNFPQKAYEIAKHYLLLAREMVLEKVRIEKCPNAPSRQSCIFLIDSDNDIQKWKSELIAGDEYQILEVFATGNAIKVDSSYLPVGHEPISEWELKASKYWGCDLSNNPCMEILFEGDVIVEKVLETNIFH